MSANLPTQIRELVRTVSDLCRQVRALAARLEVLEREQAHQGVELDRLDLRLRPFGDGTPDREIWRRWPSRRRGRR